ncbi:MAG: AAA family ATPase [Bacteroidetes bacterium]|nr:AAA family ATPase [Bacteroidota bacterium]
MDELQSLMDAVRLTPDNVPLRKYLCAELLRRQRWAEAEIELKDTLKLAPSDAELKIGLATAFCEQQKTSLGLVIIEELTAAPAPPPRTWLVYAKLLQQARQPQQAKDAYEKAVLLDPTLKDAFLESDINLSLQKGETPEPLRVPAHGDLNAENSERLIDVERPKVTFEQVGGMDAVKEEIRMKIIHPLRHPDLYKAYGKKIGGGILLYGPPGCGKTHLARATAGEINANFISVGISDILDMWIGQSEKNLHAIYEQARMMKPCVLFFDEVDALGANRSDMRHSAGKQLINQFLQEMDGIDGDNEGVLVLAATNAPWHLDPAFRRPGRFDRIIFVPPPDESARSAIFNILLKDKPVENMDVNALAKKTPDFSGADLQAVVDIAIESKLEEAMRTDVPVPLRTADLENAAKKHRATTKEWFTTAKNYALFANEGGLYDDILGYLKIRK